MLMPVQFPDDLVVTRCWVEKRHIRPIDEWWAAPVNRIGVPVRVATRIDRAIVAANKESETARRLLTVPAVGPIGASAFAGLVGDPSAFRSGRDFAAWLGLTPREHSSGGRQSRGRISKKGDRYLRRLLVIGATSVLRRPDGAGPALAAWIRQLLASKPARLVTVALANKIARIVWAVMARNDTFRRTAQAAA